LASSSHLALVFGNEVDGLSAEDLSLCDLVAEIPMKGRKESLNVAVSVGIVLFSLITN
ncbi:MAG: TrmH family RNA methyltransferase, partial [Candidatus Pacebacteria bacterium]|nr:TrmH family RNA methyltransferase [Candidatus Paceibacterota bacterium]